MTPLTLFKEEAFQSKNYIKQKPAYVQRGTTDDVHEINHIAQKQWQWDRETMTVRQRPWQWGRDNETSLRPARHHRWCPWGQWRCPEPMTVRQRDNDSETEPMTVRQRQWQWDRANDSEAETRKPAYVQRGTPDDVHGVNDVAQRLAHLAPVSITHDPMQQHLWGSGTHQHPETCKHALTLFIIISENLGMWWLNW